MTEKDTKEEEVHDEDFFDDYNENDNYLIDKALWNIKDNPCGVHNRPWRIPLYIIQFLDEDKTVKMPDHILPEQKYKSTKKKLMNQKKMKKELESIYT